MSDKRYHRVVVGPPRSGKSTFVDELVDAHLARDGVVWLARPRSAQPPYDRWPWPGFTVTPGDQWTTSDGGTLLDSAANQVTEAVVRADARIFGTPVLVVLDEVDLLKLLDLEHPDTDPPTSDLCRILERGEEVGFRLLLTVPEDAFGELSPHVREAISTHAEVSEPAPAHATEK